MISHHDCYSYWFHYWLTFSHFMPPFSFCYYFYLMCYFQIITSSLNCPLSDCLIHFLSLFMKPLLSHSQKINLRSFLHLISSSYASLPKSSSYLLMALSLSFLLPMVHCSSSRMEPYLTCLMLILALIQLPFHLYRLNGHS